MVPWGTRVHYKFIVDGHWTISDGQPAEYDDSGNLNNVFDSPARPPTPTESQTPSPVSEPTLVEPTLPSGQANGVITTVKEAAIAMVEAIAPGTTQTPAETPSAETQLEEPEAIPLAEEVIVEEKVIETAPSHETIVEQEVVEEAKTEAILPVPAEDISTAPVIPVPVLPLNTVEEAKRLETGLVEGSATIQPETAVEPSTHTPVEVSKLNGHAEKALETKVAEASTTVDPNAMQPSTHTPVPLIEKASTTNGTVLEPSTHTPAPEPAAEEVPATNGVAAELATSAAAVEATPVTEEPAEVKPEAIALPLPTPAEVPLPSSPGVNGNGKMTPPPSSSVASSPQTSPRKEKKHSFPSFGKHSRRSSSMSVSTRGTVDEHGTLETPSRNGTTTRKKRNSIFAKIKDIFTDHDHHQHPLPNGQKK